MSFYVPVAESKYDNISNLLLLCPLIFGLMCALVLPLKYRLSFISSLLHSSTLSVQNQQFSQGVHVLPSLFSHQMSPAGLPPPRTTLLSGHGEPQQGSSCCGNSLLAMGPSRVHAKDYNTDSFGLCLTEIIIRQYSH